MRKTVTVAVVAICLLPTTPWARDIRCVGISDVPNERGIPLSPERIVRVPEAQQSEALLTLGSRAFSRLSESQVNRLLAPEQPPSSDSLLLRQAEDAADKAAQCRELAGNPSYAYMREHDLEAASKYEEYAAYTRALSRDLHPYLVKGKALFEGTGSFSAYLKNHRLSLFHGSLGRGPREPEDVAVVVFVEDEVQDVFVSFGGAE